MNPAFIVDQVKVGRSAEGSLRSIREMMKLTLFDLTKNPLKQRLSVRIESFGRSTNQLSQRELHSSGISSSHPTLIRHRSWRISFAVRTKNAWKPKGLKILPATDRIPLRVGGLELIQTLKRNESDTTPHCTLKPHWTGYSSLRA